jgi:predicted ArsR family transcriptional regulator
VTVRKINIENLAKTLFMLQTGPLTAAMLAREINVHLVTAQSWLRQLRRQRAVHVTEWLQDRLGRDAIPVFALGDGEDAQRRRESRAVINRRYLEKKRGTTIGA